MSTFDLKEYFFARVVFHDFFQLIFKQPIVIQISIFQGYSKFSIKSGEKPYSRDQNCLVACCIV